MTAIVITYAGLVGFVMPALDEKKVVPDVAASLPAAGKDSRRIATYRMDR